jgi:hypothetical protein
MTAADTARDLAWYSIFIERRDPAGDAEATRIEHAYSFEELAVAVQDPGQALENLASARIADGWDADDAGLRDT